MDRRAFFGTLAGLAAPLVAEGQSTKVYRIGLLIGASEAFVVPYIEIFRHALRDVGYVEGRTSPSS